MFRTARRSIPLALVIGALAFASIDGARARGAVTKEDVERAIRDGVRFLKQAQRDDGSWDDLSPQAKTGTTSLVTLALLTSGEKADSPHIRKALDFLRRFGPDDLRSTYAIALQTMVFAAAEPERDQLRIVANVDWLESAQIEAGQRGHWPAAGLTPRFPRAATIATPSTHSWACNAASRGGRAGQARGLGARQAVLGEGPAAGRRLGLPRQRRRCPPRA